MLKSVICIIVLQTLAEKLLLLIIIEVNNGCLISKCTFAYFAQLLPIGVDNYYCYGYQQSTKRDSRHTNYSLISRETVDKLIQSDWKGHALVYVSCNNSVKYRDAQELPL